MTIEIVYKLIYLTLTLVGIGLLLLLHSDFMKNTVIEDHWMPDEVYEEVINILTIFVLIVIGLFSVWVVIL